MAGGGKHTWRSTGAPPKPTGVGGPRSGDPGTGGDDDPCDIHFETALNSVDEIAVKNVTRGMSLQIELVEENKIPRLRAALNGIPIGVISHPNAIAIIGCIKRGNNYVAVVTERQGNLCRIRVERQAL